MVHSSRVNRAASFSLLFVGLMAAAAAAATRVAVLAPSGASAEKIASLLELSLGTDENVQLVERGQFSAILHEQELAACFGADASATRLNIGKLVNADMLVVLREVAGPKPHLELVVFESRLGVRLLVEPIPLTDDLSADAGQIEKRVLAALGKLRQRITAIVAVPAFVCDDLTREHADDGDGYADLIEQSLLARKGVVVVEIAEAQAIARELAIAGQPDPDRPLPFILLGNFSDSGSSRTVSFHLTLNQGQKTIASASARAADLSQLAQTLLEATDRLIGSTFSKPAAAPDPDADARELYSRGTEFLDIGEASRGLSLCEASLLLRQIPSAHRDAAFAALEICIADQNTASTDRAAASSRTLPAGFPESCRPMLQRGFDHVEAYMKLTRLNYLSGSDQILRRYGMILPPREFAEMLERVAEAKFAAQVKDDTLRYAANVRWDAITPPAERYGLASRISICAQQPGDVPAIVAMFHDDGKDSAERRDAIHALSVSDNRFAKAAAAAIETASAPSNPSPAAAPTTALATRPVLTDRSAISLVKLHLGMKPVLGCAAAGDGLGSRLGNDRSR
jgi:hypothetical protein